MPHRYQLLVFDWDGTLINSCNHIAEAIQAAATDLEFDTYNKDKIKELLGCGMFNVLKTLYPDSTEAERQQLIERYKHHFFAGAHRPSLYEGVEETLKELNERGFWLAIATGESRKKLEEALTALNLIHYFHALRCGDEAPAKPHPQMLLDIMDVLGISPQQTLMIGDTEFDMQMALNAKVDALAVECGVHDRERLLRCSPIGHIANIKELPGFLLQKDWV